MICLVKSTCCLWDSPGYTAPGLSIIYCLPHNDPCTRPRKGELANVNVSSLPASSQLMLAPPPSRDEGQIRISLDTTHYNQPTPPVYNHCSCLHCAVYSECVVYSVQQLCAMFSGVCSVQYVVQCAVLNVQCAVCIIVFSVQSKQYSVQCKQYSVQYKQYSV